MIVHKVILELRQGLSIELAEGRLADHGILLAQLRALASMLDDPDLHKFVEKLAAREEAVAKRAVERKKEIAARDAKRARAAQADLDASKSAQKRYT